MNIVNYQNQAVKQNPHGVDVRQLYGSEHAHIMHITLQPGEFIQAHAAPVDVVFVVLEGRPTIQLDNSAEVCEANALIESHAGDLHSIINDSESVARIMVIKLLNQRTVK